MRSFIDKRTLPSGEDIGAKATNLYLEIEHPLDDKTSLFTYILPRDSHSAFVVACWDRAFEPLLERWDSDKADMVASTWPTLAALLHNGINGLYKDGALITLEDVDDGEVEWFVASVAGNIKCDSLEGLLCERTLTASKVVTAQSLNLFFELTNNQPSKLRVLGKGFLQGVVDALGFAAKNTLLFGLSADVGTVGTSFEKPEAFKYFERLRKK
jgi:hypothetical protein